MVDSCTNRSLWDDYHSVDAAFSGFFTAFDADIWTAFTSKGSDFYHPLWGFIIVFETTFNIAILAFSVYILINFYRKKHFYHGY